VANLLGYRPQRAADHFAFLVPHREFERGLQHD